jgi:uncharacterized protein (DUF4415 family)
MNNTDNPKEDLLGEYDFDYSQAKPNRFAKKAVTITLDADIAEIFTDSKAVNKALRAILSAYPRSFIHREASSL